MVVIILPTSRAMKVEKDIANLTRAANVACLPQRPESALGVSGLALWCRVISAAGSHVFEARRHCL